MCLPFCFSLLPAMLAYSSSCNDSILLGPFLGRPFYSFSQWPIIGTILFPFIHGLLCPFVFFFWASTAYLLILLRFLGLFANSTLPWALLLTSLGFPGPITLSYLWVLWACHKSLTFLVYITLGLQRPFLTFLAHILPMRCYFSLSWLL